jgi:YhcH/YjgK/YiaL family protein
VTTFRGDAVYALRQEYLSKRREDGKWESHRRYADIQFIYEGVEQMGYAPISSLDATCAYDEKGDCLLYKGSGQYFVLEPGWFVIFFPEDGHMPGIAAAGSETVRKIVVKAAVS